MKLKTLLVVALSVLSFMCNAKELRIAAWNLEHLNADGNEGCVTRAQDDYDVIINSINELKYDVVGIQEVKDVAAARRVFPEDEWEIEISTRPPMEESRECWYSEGRYLQHLGTGFAIRKGIEYRRNPDFKALGLDDDFQRWGTDVTILGESNLRLLSVHLKSGCFGPPQDNDPSRTETCAVLKRQMMELLSWRDQRIQEEVPFAIIGDFNRRLGLKDDWGWSILTSEYAQLVLLTESIQPKCDPRYSDLIDHLVVNRLAHELVIEDSVLEGPRVGENPDHCAVSAVFRL